MTTKDGLAHPKPERRGPKARQRIARRVRPPSKAKIKSLTRTMHRKAWVVFSQVRRRAAIICGSAVMAECYTCRRTYPWMDMDAGHYRHGVLDFDEMNVHAQCVRCNQHEHGARDEYYIRLVSDYGQAAVDDLRVRANNFTGYSLAELTAFYLKYKELNETC